MIDKVIGTHLLIASACCGMTWKPSGRHTLEQITTGTKQIGFAWGKSADPLRTIRKVLWIYDRSPRDTFLFSMGRTLANHTQARIMSKLGIRYEVDHLQDSKFRSKGCIAKQFTQRLQSEKNNVMERSFTTHNTRVRRSSPFSKDLKNPERHHKITDESLGEVRPFDEKGKGRHSYYIGFSSLRDGVEIMRWGSVSGHRMQS